MACFWARLLEKQFQLQANGTTIRTECLAGLTTFVAMAYIIFVVPQMLASAGMPHNEAVSATVLVTVVATAMMGLWANLPVAVAPGIGLTVFFSYYVCGTLGLNWTVALGAVFLSGVVFLFLTVTRLRQSIIAAVPPNLKKAIVVGIGLFIAFVGLQQSGIIVKSADTGVTLGNMSSPGPLLTCFGMFFTAGLIAHKVNGNILLGIVATTIVGMVLGVCPIPTSMASVFSFEWPSMGAIVMQLDIKGAIEYGLLSTIFTFTIVELFDNIGVLIGVSRKAGLVDEQGNIKNIDRALITDSCATMAGSVLGTPVATSYLESAAGVAMGGRTGLTALVVALLFAVSLVFIPLVALVPPFATAVALIMVGALMMTEVNSIEFTDLSEGFPAFMVIIMMPMTYSIASGIGFGFISYVCIKALSGRIRETNSVTWIIAGLFLINFALRGN